MNARLFAFLCLLLVSRSTVFPADPYVIDHRQSPHAVLRPLPYDAVQSTDGFWADRYRQLVDVTLGESWRLLADPNEGHVLDNFRIAAGQMKGEYAGTTWQDEWLYKWLEAAACVWRNTRDAALARRMDQAIALIAAAQQSDGYLATMSIVKRTPRFQTAQDHELYNMGHLISAGVVHHRMTGQDSFLQVARRAADFMCANVGPTVAPSTAHNPSALMGLVELFRLTRERRYLDCAQLIIDRRSTTTVVLRGAALQRIEPRDAALYRPLSDAPLQRFELTLIPYYAWANRGPSAVSVWLPVVHKRGRGRKLTGRRRVPMLAAAASERRPATNLIATARNFTTVPGGSTPPHESPFLRSRSNAAIAPGLHYVEGNRGAVSSRPSRPIHPRSIRLHRRRNQRPH